MVTVVDIPMHAADCKVLDLWNGSSNNAPPANWDTVTFDDSAWATAVQPTINSSNSYGAVSWTSTLWPDLPTPVNTSTPILPPSGCQSVSTTLATPGAHAQFLIRWRFSMPAIRWRRVDSGIWTSGVTPSGGGATRMASTISAQLNKTLGGSSHDLIFPNTVTVSFFNWGLPGQTNLVAHAVNAFAPFPTLVGENWVAEMWETLFLRFQLASLGNWAAVVG